MAKIVAKSGHPHSRVSIEGRMDDASLLTIDVIRGLGQKIRSTLIQQGVKQIEPPGEEPNDFALAMAYMSGAAQRVADEAQAPNQTEDPANDEVPTKH